MGIRTFAILPEWPDEEYRDIQDGLVVQWIVCGFPEPKIQVRFLARLLIRNGKPLTDE